MNRSNRFPDLKSQTEIDAESSSVKEQTMNLALNFPAEFVAVAATYLIGLTAFAYGLVGILKLTGHEKKVIQRLKELGQ